LVSEVAAAAFLRHALAEIDQKTRSFQDGSTFTGAVIARDGSIVTAHLGDSLASAIVINQECDLVYTQTLTCCHLPQATGKEEVASDGTRYFDTTRYRYLVKEDGSHGFGIAISRALGNARFGAAVSHEPDVKVHSFKTDFLSCKRVFLLVTSDGAHKVGGPEHIHHAHYVASALKTGTDVGTIAKDIAARSLSTLDNISVVLVEVQREEGSIVAVLDGHGHTAAVADIGVCILKQEVSSFVQDRLQSSDRISKGDWLYP
jgi:serine/threonine protein phosphatase PrpC